MGKTLTVESTLTLPQDKLVTGAKLKLPTTISEDYSMHASDTILYKSLGVTQDTNDGSLIMNGTDPFSYISQVSSYYSIQRIHVVVANDNNTFEIKVGNTQGNTSHTIPQPAMINNIYTYEIPVDLYGYNNVYQVVRTSSVRTCNLKLLVEYYSSEGSDVYKAREWAKTFLEQTGSQCVAQNIKSSTWTNLQVSWNQLEVDSWNCFKEERLELSVCITDIQKTDERYLYIVNKYRNLFDFWYRTSISASPDSPLLVENHANTMIITSVIGTFVALTLSIGMIILRKKKQH